MLIHVINSSENDYNIARMRIEAYKEYAQYLEPSSWVDMQKSLSNVTNQPKFGSLIVAEENNIITGSVVYFPPGQSNPKLFPQEWASIRLLAVLPNFRNKGIGRRLTNECINRAIENNALYIGLHTSELMKTAILMYESMGFNRDIELPQMFGLRYWRYVLRLKK
jgi:ribosomal protein S18 acetylase RimI-like enzyme